MQFADIASSTALTEQLDPEDAHAVLYGVVERMSAACTDELVARYGGGMQVRAGVHAGEVVAFFVGAEDQSSWNALGPPVPKTARMEQSAAPGTIQVTASTLDSVGHFFESEELEPVLFKGMSKPLADPRSGDTSHLFNAGNHCLRLCEYHEVLILTPDIVPAQLAPRARNIP